jgi:uncharacterized phage protein (TIGR02218 family)
MKTGAATLNTHLAGEELTLATCWRIQRQDGVVKAFTDHDRDLVVSGVTYKAASGYTRSAIATGSELAVDNLTVEGLLDSAELTAEDLRAGAYDHASFEICWVNWANPAGGILKLRTGWLGEVRETRGQFAVELRGLLQAYSRHLGQLYTPSCRADFGDARCGLDLTPLTITGSVTGTGGDRLSWTDTARTEPNAWFEGGLVTWLSGANAGRAMEVKYYTLSTQILTLYLPTPYAIQIGDTYELSPGCDKRLSTCRDRWDNVVNFRGEPHVPGLDRMLRTVDASGSAGGESSSPPADPTPPAEPPAPPAGGGGGGGLTTPPSTSFSAVVSNTNDSGAGSLRQALLAAQANGGRTAITFSAGGTISLATHLPAMDQPTIVILGETAPSPVVLDGAACAYSGSGRGVFEMTAPNGFVRGVTVQHFLDPSNVIDGVRVKWNGSGCVIEDVTLDDWGGDEGLSIAQNCLDVVVNRVSVSGTRGVRAFLLDNSSSATYTDCVVDGCRGGYRIKGSSSGAYQGCTSRNSHYGLWADEDNDWTADDCTFEDLSDVGVYADGGTGSLTNTTVQRIDGYSVRARRTGATATSLTVEASTLRDGTSHGVYIEDDAVVDLGGGSRGSAGGNTLQGHAGTDLYNATSPALTVKAEANTWDHTSVSTVLANDVFGAADVDPLA